MKVWLITGVSRGIGAALARIAFEDGDTVIGTVRTEQDRRVFEAQSPVRARGLIIDLCRSDYLADIIDAAIASTCRIDVLVNNAGMNLFGTVEETSLDELRQVFALNLLAPFEIIKAVLPYMRAQGGGRIVNISSGSGINGTPCGGIYSVSKFALEGMSEALAKEVAGQGVDLLLVEPGAVDTGFIAQSTPETARRLSPYVELTGNGKAALLRYYETGALNPVEIAHSIRAALISDPLPFRLILGDDVKRSAARKAEELRMLAQVAALEE